MKSKNNKWIYPLINILLYCVGFPILFIIALVKSIEWNSYGMYGASAFAPLIAVIIVALLVLGIQALVYFLSAKKGKLGNKLMLKMLVVPVAVIVGLFGIIDMAMPSLLKDATSNTILYEDVVNDYQGMHDKLVVRVEEFKKKNGLAESVKYQDEEFQKIFKPLFASMDKAYNSFDKLAIEMALAQPDMMAGLLNGSFPVKVAASLILKTSDIENANNNNATLDELIAYNITAILDAVEELGKIGLDNLTTDNINNIVNKILVTKKFDGIEWNIFNILGENILFSEFDPNATIYKNTYNELGEVTGRELVGGCLGYQDMSWLNGIPQMFFIPLMSVRETFYIFAGILALATIMQFFVAELYQQKYNTKFSLLCLAK